MKWTYPKTTRVVIVQTDDVEYLQAGCRPIQAMPAAQWRLCQASMRPQGYRIVCQFRVPMRRLAPGWGWWGFACTIIERLGFDHLRAMLGEIEAGVMLAGEEVTA